MFLNSRNIPCWLDPDSSLTSHVSVDLLTWHSKNEPTLMSLRWRGCHIPKTHAWHMLAHAQHKSTHAQHMPSHADNVPLLTGACRQHVNFPAMCYPDLWLSQQDEQSQVVESCVWLRLVASILKKHLRLHFFGIRMDREHYSEFVQRRSEQFWARLNKTNKTP